MSKIIEVRPNGTKRVATLNNEPSLTDQSQKKDCDINVIVAKYLKTGQVKHLAKRVGQYADVSNIPDLSEAIMQVRAAQDAFDALPAQLRQKLNNDPTQMISYLNDSSKLAEHYDLGIRIKPKSEQKDQGPAPEAPK